MYLNLGPAKRKNKLYRYDTTVSVPRRTQYRKRRVIAEELERVNNVLPEVEVAENNSEASSDIEIDTISENDFQFEDGNEPNEGQEFVDCNAHTCGGNNSEDSESDQSIYDNSSISSSSSISSNATDSSSTESEEEDEITEYDDKKMHEMVMLKYITRHSINHKATNDLLAVIQAIAPDQSPIQQVCMKDIFKIYLIVYHYCGNCGQPFPLDNLLQTVCSNNTCGG